MEARRQPYVKPSMIRLHYEADLAVSLQSSCKSNNTPGSGSLTENCGVADAGGQCNTTSDS
jgi:hypothetical protein